MHHVIILGAGASRDAGGPLMADLIDRAEGLRWDSNAHINQAEFDLVFQGVAALQTTQSKAILDIENIESVMAAFEMAALTETLGTFKSEDVLRLPAAVALLVSETVEETIYFDVRKDAVHAPSSYGGLGTLIQALRKAQESVSLITFNYDLCADVVLNDLGCSADYGLLDATPSAGAVELLKLHGSLNWSADAAGAIRSLPMRDRLIKWRIDPDDAGEGPFRIRQDLGRWLQGTTGRPIIVPPTWNKTEHYKGVRNVWKRAAATLCKAENIYVFGYSLPETDQFFRLLYAIGTVGSTRLKRFWVCDPSTVSARRFEGLLGQAAVRRFSHFPETFNVATTRVFQRLDQESVF
jgi:hypothetical protein